MADDDRLTGRELGLGCGLALLGLPASIALQGLAWLLLWGWFVQPFGAPPITYGHALGLAVCATLARGPTSTVASQERLKREFSQRDRFRMGLTTVLSHAMQFAMILAFGWLIHGVMS